MQASRLVKISLFSALIAMSAVIKIPIPYCPITMQTMFVAYAGILLGKKDGCISVLVYVLVGLVGVPVFTNGAGVTYFLQPTFGYLLGMILAPWIIGWTMEQSRPASVAARALLGTSLGFVVIYLVGLPYMALILNGYMNLGKSLADILLTGLVLSLPGDLLKLLVVTVTAPALCRMMPKDRLLPKSL